MPLVSRYIVRQLIAVSILVAVTLTLAIWLTQSLRFVEMIVNRGLSLDSYLYLTVLLLPSFLSIMLPIALFTAVLFTYNKLTTDSELIVLRAVGLGPIQLARPALILAAVVVAIGYSVSLYFLPLSYRAFKDLEFDIRNDYSAVLLKEGAFNNVNEKVTVYIRARELDGELHGILVHDDRQREKVVTILAERGKLAITDEGPRVIMVNGNRQEVERDTGKLTFLYFERYSVDLGKVGQAAQERRWREPRERYLHELLWPNDSPEDQHFANRLRAEGHNRLTSPLLAFAFAMISLAALLSGDFNRRGQSRRVVMAIGLVAALQTLAIGSANAVAKWPVLAPVPYVTIAITIAVASWWLLRPQRRPTQSPALVPIG